MDNSTSSSVIHMDVKATQAVEVTDISQSHPLKATMILLFPVLGCFPMYGSTVSQARK